MAVQRYEQSPSSGYLRNGEILSGLRIPTIQWQFESKIDLREERDLTVISHPYVVVVSQECDLYWDYVARSRDDSSGEGLGNKDISEILVADLYTMAELTASSDIRVKAWGRIKKLENPRYHSLEAATDEDEGIDIPERSVDFKSMFGVDPNLMYSLLAQDDIQRLGRLANGYRLQMIQRLMAYQGRVDLPDDFEET